MIMPSISINFTLHYLLKSRNYKTLTIDFCMTLARSLGLAGFGFFHEFFKMGRVVMLKQPSENPLILL